ncbi:MAG: (d)CMP kinase [Planctomycetota bacterium]|nr:(d)CMP kinase [Planctomycetota bacterium]
MSSKPTPPPLIVAIDGPAGSGKSTAARMLAREVGFAHLNTGAMYRAVAYLVEEGGIDVEDGERVAKVARDMMFEYDCATNSGDPRFVVAGREGAKRRDLTDGLFTAALTQKLKPVVNNDKVREALVAKMRQAALDVLEHHAPGVVLEGRDIGTVVFPDALIKFYVQADLEERTRRRAAELQARGEIYDLDGLRKQIEYRDHVDASRAVGPLKKADDALEIDTTFLSQAETLAKLVAALERRRAERGV